MPSRSNTSVYLAQCLAPRSGTVHGDRFIYPAYLMKKTGMFSRCGAVAELLAYCCVFLFFVLFVDDLDAARFCFRRVPRIN